MKTLTLEVGASIHEFWETSSFNPQQWVAMAKKYIHSFHIRNLNMRKVSNTNLTGLKKIMFCIVSGIMDAR